MALFLAAMLCCVVSLQWWGATAGSCGGGCFVVHAAAGYVSRSGSCGPWGVGVAQGHRGASLGQASAWAAVLGLLACWWPAAGGAAHLHRTGAEYCVVRGAMPYPCRIGS